MAKAGNGARRYFAGKMTFMEIPKAGHMAIDPTLPRTILQRLNTAHSAWQHRLQGRVTQEALTKATQNEKGAFYWTVPTPDTGNPRRPTPRPGGQRPKL